MTGEDFSLVCCHFCEIGAPTNINNFLKRKKMRKLCLVCMCLLLIGPTSPAIADLDGIQVLSEQYHVDGGISGTEWGGNHYYYSLDSTNSSGINDSISSDDGEAYSSAGEFFVSAFADGLSDTTYPYATASVLFQTVGSGWLHAELVVASYLIGDAYGDLCDSAGDQLQLGGFPWVGERSRTQGGLTTTPTRFHYLCRHIVRKATPLMLM